MITTKRRTPCIEKLDRLPWAHAFAFRAHGAVVGVRATDRRALERVAEELPPDATIIETPGVVDGLYSWVYAGEGTGRRVHIVFEEFREVARTTSEDEALRAIRGDLDFQVALHAPERLFVHAGVVGWEGRAIVIPGRSFTGKSTLVAALVRAGATYYSDEFAVLDEGGRVHPYARRLALRDERGATRGRFDVASLGGVAGVDPLPLGIVLDTEYRAGATWAPRPVSAAQAVLKLLDNAVVARLRPELTMARVTTAAAHTLVWRGARGDADATAASILERASAAFATTPADRRSVVA